MGSIVLRDFISPFQDFILYLGMVTKNRILIALAAVVLSLAATTSYGQSLSFHSLTTSEGLSHTKVNDIYNDEYGIVWIGTNYGLNRFDGHSVEVFLNEKGNEDSLPHNNVTRITGDGQGHIWLTCATGLAELDLNTMKFKRVHKGTIHAIYYNKENRRLYATSGRKIIERKENGKFSEIANIGTPSHISDIITHGKLVIAGTSGHGIWKIDLSNNSQECIISSSKVTRLHMDSQSNIWAGSWEDGLCRISPDGKITTFRHNAKVRESLSSDFVRCCCEDDSGRIWIGTDIGLDCYDLKAGRFIHSPHNKGSNAKINHPSIWCLSKDNQGNIWLGSYFGGVNWFNPDHNIYTLYHHSTIEGEGLSHPIVGCIKEDKYGNLWIATEGGGVNYLDRKSGHIKWYTKESHNLTSNNIQALYYDENRELLWIGTHLGGLNRLDIRKGTVKACFPKKGPKNQVTQSLIKDIHPYKDSLILSTHFGVYMFDPITEKYRRLFSDDQMKKITRVSSDILIDSNENLWVAIMNNGVIRKHLPTGKTVWFRNSGEGSISDTNIESITEDSDGNIWLATSYSGLDMYDASTETFLNFSRHNHALAYDHTYTLTHSVTSGNLLVSTPAGFCSFNPKTKKGNNYNHSNGFPLTDINDNSIYVTRDSTVFIGSIHGMVSFKEGAHERIKKPYNITMSRLIVNGEEVRPTGKTGILPQSLLTTTTLTLPHDALMFSIEVSTSDYLSTVSGDLQYMLEGFSDEWHDIRQNTITYSNLASGRYTLHVRSASDNEDICPKKSLEIIVTPPWYLTWWALTIWILLAITIISLVVRYYNRAIQIRDIERLNQSKLNFFTNISHEIRTPLTVIIAQVESLIYSKDFTPAIYNKVLSIYKNSVHLKSLISELLEFRKQEQGELKIKVAPHDIVKMVSEFYLVFEEYANTRNIDLIMEKEINHLEVWYDRTQLQKVFRNLISNALKYTEAGGKVKMFIGMSENKMLFRISDSGCGMSDDDKSNIFRSFYRVARQENKGQDGTGIGLALTKGIIEQHHGTINVESSLGKGTTFTLTLPLGYSHFNPDEIEEDKSSDQNESQDIYDTASSPRRKDKTMLIVDDNEAIRNLIADIFAPFYNIKTAADGEKGWEIVSTDLPDIVVSDVLMPKMPGTDLCRKIKSEMATCHIPVVLLTARVDIEHNIEGILTGADDYIAKPFNTRLLITRCNNLVNSRIILQEKFSQNPDTSSKILATNMIDKEIMDKATAIIEKNLDNPDFNVNTFAHEMALSRTNLFTKLKAITGQTPNELVMTLRLKKAAYMLKNNPELSIVEIADRTGFNSVKYFSKCFNDTYHIRPAAYRSNTEN